MRVNNSSGKYKGLTQGLLLAPLSPGLICEEFLFLQTGRRYLRTGFPSPSHKDMCDSRPVCRGSVPMTGDHTDAHVSSVRCSVSAGVEGRVRFPRQERRAASAVIPEFPRFRQPLLSDGLIARYTLQQALASTDNSQRQSELYSVIV